MKQHVSIVYLTERIPRAQSFLSSDMENVIGEKYCNKHNLIVLENSADEIKIVLAKENLFCIDELRKVLPKEKESLPCWLKKKKFRESSPEAMISLA